MKICFNVALPACAKAVILLMCYCIAFSANSDSTRFTTYEYDQAGNLVAVRTFVNTGPPDVTGLSPSFINQGNSALIQIEGINLANAAVSVDTPGIRVLQVDNISDTQISVRFLADRSARLGEAPITFATPLGTDIENIIIAARAPVVVTQPSPILLAPNGETLAIKLLFDQAFPNDQTYDVAISNNDIATLTEQSFTLLADAIVANITVTSNNVGNTSLEINQLANFLSINIPVIVADSFTLPVGEQFANSQPFGVTVFRFEPNTSANTATTAPLHILRNSFQPSAGASTAISSQLQVLRKNAEPLSGTSFATSSALGVTVNTFQFPNQSFQAITEDIQVILPPVAKLITPNQVPIGATQTLIINGTGLDAVSEVHFFPEADITQTIPFTSNPEGTQLNVFINVATTAATGVRKISLTNLQGNIPFSATDNDLIDITN